MLTLVTGAIVTVLMVVTPASSERVVVTTDDGKISGVKLKAIKGQNFYSFRSIPYAKPPVGDLRFRDPVPGDGWTGVRDGGVMAKVCPQISPKNKIYSGEEDCLYLTVSTTKPGKFEARLPVMVYIHGGGHFSEGNPVYPSTVFMDYEVIYVGLQYRLGVLGFLSTEDSIIPGNFGLKDQSMALRWIQKNIRYFGGDPKKVTIFGNSSGAVCVHCHVLSPHSKGLFTRAIIQSGNTFISSALSRSSRNLAYYTGKMFGCPHKHEMSSEETSLALFNCLLKVDVQNVTLSLIEHYENQFQFVYFGPRVDGDFLPDDPAVLMSEAKYNMVDIMTGITMHEGYLNTKDLYTNENMKKDLETNFGLTGPLMLQLQHEPFPTRLVSRIFQHYVGGVKFYQKDVLKILKMTTDINYAYPHDLLSRLHVKNAWPGQNTFLYTYKYRGQRSLWDHPPCHLNTETWVGHGDELFNFFSGNDIQWKTLEGKEDLEMREIMLSLWINFSDTGNPTPDNSLGFKWQATSPEDLSHISLTLNPYMEPDPYREVRAFWETLPIRINLLLNPEKVIFSTSEPQIRSDTAETRSMKHQHSEL